ncbi:MAG: hypothetical protein NWF07_13875 [Candidatus Bathyarchaeota archaeon]|nr:hypothetical protein [Candidatus Bathyarchaeota archaeon]
MEEKTQEPMTTDNKMVEILVICPRGIELPEYTFLSEMAEQDINNYMLENKHPHTFNFAVRSADGTGMNAYNLAKQHYDNGNKLIVGLSWSSQLDTFFSFAQSNDCLVISPGSTQTWPWKLAPNTYRMYPADHLYTVPLVRCVENLNISKVILVQSEGYMKTMDDDFMEEYSGEVSTIRIEHDIDYSEVNSSTLLLEEEINESTKEYGEDHVAVYFIGSSYLLEKILDTTTDDTLYSVPWFVWNWFTWHQDLGTRYSRFEENKTQLTPLQILGVHPAIPDNPTYHRVNQAYLEEFNQSISMIHGNIYDALWITALAVAETNSTDGTTVGLAIPDIAKTHVGVTGNCSFNDWGDRWGVDWSVYGYDFTGDQPIVTMYGFYNFTTDEVTWRDR